jgi:RimJ/RimL family protein N-acetyltransferase
MPSLRLPDPPLGDGEIVLRATRLLARWALTDLGLERLEPLANPENEASQRLAERAGFTREGLLRRYRRRPAGARIS